MKFTVKYTEKFTINLTKDFSETYYKLPSSWLGILLKKFGIMVLKENLTKKVKYWEKLQITFLLMSTAIATHVFCRGPRVLAPKRGFGSSDTI